MSSVPASKCRSGDSSQFTCVDVDVEDELEESVDVIVVLEAVVVVVAVDVVHTPHKKGHATLKLRTNGSVSSPVQNSALLGVQMSGSAYVAQSRSVVVGIPVDVEGASLDGKEVASDAVDELDVVSVEVEVDRDDVEVEVVIDEVLSVFIL